MIQRGDANMGRFEVELTLANNDDVVMSEAASPKSEPQQIRIQGIVDTGATRLVLPESVVDQLSLSRSGEATVRYADQPSNVRPMVKNVWLSLLDRESVFSAIVEPDRKTALVGAIVLEELDLLVDCGKQKLYPRDPDRIVSEIE